jgi:hypothetical protein
MLRRSRMPLERTLDEMQGGLRPAMEAVKKDDIKEAERALLLVGDLLDRLLKASK